MRGARGMRMSSRSLKLLWLKRIETHRLPLPRRTIGQYELPAATKA